MLILVTYDVNTTNEGGKKRLRKVAKIMEDFGIRVQNSVFECSIDNAQFLMIKDKLKHVISNEDSVRFYRMGKHWKTKVEVMGKAYIEDPSKDTYIF